MRIYAILSFFAIIMMLVYWYMGGTSHVEVENQISQTFSFGNIGFLELKYEYNLLSQEMDKVSL